MICEVSVIWVEKQFQELCKKPYWGHPRGCPNYGKKKGCPPNVRLFDFDKYEDLYVIYTEFNIGKHVRKMRGKHRDWTERQLYCCLYWQGTARKNLKGEIKKFLEKFTKHKVFSCPEAMGINVTDLMNDNTGIELEWPPMNYAYQVALGAKRRAK